MHQLVKFQHNIAKRGQVIDHLTNLSML